MDSLRDATKGIDAIYHSAARVTTQGDRSQFYNDNVMSTRCLVDEAKKAGAKDAYPVCVAKGTEMIIDA